MPSYPSNPPEVLRPGIVGRLAPSPTGAQHLGNARTYLIAWLYARSRDGEVRLRIEDIDSPRVKVGAAEEALNDLNGKFGRYTLTRVASDELANPNSHEVIVAGRRSLHEGLRSAGMPA